MTSQQPRKTPKIRPKTVSRGRPSTGKSIGRPPRFESVEDLQNKIDQYFEWVNGEYCQVEELDPVTLNIIKWQKCVRPAEPITITGLVLYLGFCSRQSMFDYQDHPDKPEFSDAIKRARLKVEAAYEKNLHGCAVAGSIFALKNMHWKDRSEIAPVTPDGEPLQFAPPVLNITVKPAPKEDGE
jgi:hypothetical protein